MFTKVTKAAVLGGLLIGLSACGLKINENPPPTPEVNASVGMNTDCFTDAGTAFNDFFKGSATETQVYGFWNCMSFSVSEFEKNTHGKDAAVYSGRELANFFERYFLDKGQPISDSLMTEIFRLKRLFVGGSVQSLSRSEMLKSIEVMNQLKKITLKINPHMKIFNLTGKADLNDMATSRAQFAKAEADLMSSAKALTMLLKADYPLDSFMTFSKELDPILPAPGSDQTTMTEKTNRYLPLVLAYKNVLFTDAGADMGDTVGRSWDILFTFTAKIFARVAYYQYFIADQEIQSNDGAYALRSFAMGSLDTFEQIKARKPANKITATEFALLANRLETSQLLPENFKASTIQQALTLISDKFLTANIKAEVENWYVNQLNGVISFYLQDIFFTDSGRLSYLTQHRTSSGNTRFNANLISSVLRLVAKTYSATGSTAGLNEAEIDKLYKDFKPLMVAFEMVSPTDLNFGLDRARDANLFTPQANGDTFVSLKEGTDLVLMLMSGVDRDKLLRDNLYRYCSVYKTTAFWGDDTVSNVCAKSFYVSKLAEELQYMPGFYAYANGQNSVQRENIINNAMASAGAFGTQIQMIKLANMPQVIQYIEVLFARFDLNRDGILNPAEANNAWPLFRQMMLKFSGESGEDMNHAIFGYLLRHGKPPKDISEKADFLANWRYKNPLSWSISADRTRLLQVMGYVASLAK
jgi:hypothetical protein